MSQKSKPNDSTKECISVYSDYSRKLEAIVKCCIKKTKKSNNSKKSKKSDLNQKYQKS